MFRSNVVKVQRALNKIKQRKNEIAINVNTIHWHVLTSSGLKPDSRKIEAIIIMKSPTNE